jgi:hypothetical protein
MIRDGMHDSAFLKHLIVKDDGLVAAGLRRASTLFRKEEIGSIFLAFRHTSLVAMMRQIFWFLSLSHSRSQPVYQKCRVFLPRRVSDSIAPTSARNGRRKA